MTDMEPGNERPKSFVVRWRNYGHWDFIVGCSRAFRLRGGPGKWLALDERERPGPMTVFKDQATAISFITSELMWEPLTVQGQGTHEMESWNIS